QIRLQHTDSAAFNAGIGLVPAGIVVGASLWAVALACPGDNSPCVPANLITWPVVGAGMLITGIVLLARGRLVPPNDANRIELVARGASPLQLKSFGLAPSSGGGGSGALTFAF